MSEFELRKPNYRVTWHVTPRQDVEILANVIAGMAILVSAGETVLHVVPASQTLESRHTMLLTVSRESDAATRVVAIDVLDRADAFDKLALAISSIYFKCNFQPRHFTYLGSGDSIRLRPLGLAQLCVVNGSARIFLAEAAAALRAGLRHSGFGSLRSGFEAAARNLRLLYGAVDVASLLPQQPDNPQMQVVFQPRGWLETSEENVRANSWRGELVRLLRAEFGDSERIGFIRTNVRNSVSAELYLSRKIPRRDYLRMLKVAAIGVNSRGLSDSSTFKLSEYLAAGMAIVSDEMKFGLPEPLVEGVHYLKYESPAECVELCKELFADPERLAAMRAANRQYFARNLDPANQVRYLLREAFKDQKLEA